MIKIRTLSQRITFGIVILIIFALIGTAYTHGYEDGKFDCQQLNNIK